MKIANSFVFKQLNEDIELSRMNRFNSLRKLLSIERKIRMMNIILTIVFLVATCYAVRYIFFDSKAISIALLIPFLVLPPFLKALIYFRKFDLATVIGLSGFNIALFLVASSESLETGVYLHFISSSAVAITLFEYENRWKSTFFISLSSILFLAVNLFSFDFLEFREYSPENETLFFTLHTISMTAISCSGLYMVLGNNYSLQKYLMNNQKIIKNQNEDLRKANEELDRFVYSASHDLRAPLASIKGLLGIMKLEDQGDSKYGDMIIDRISVMESFIDDIVHYSRNSRAEIKSEVIELRNFVAETIEGFSHYDNAQTIEFQNEVDEKWVIQSDPYRLKVILNNFISNAIKYADIRKDCPFVKVSYQLSTEYNSIVVSDNGIGIDAEHLSEVFRMFYRATQTSEGTGLGLYIAVESADKLGYELEASSKKEVGSSFKIKMPVLAQKSELTK